MKAEFASPLLSHQAGGARRFNNLYTLVLGGLDMIGRQLLLFLTLTVAEFIKCGQAALRAIDAILAGERRTERTRGGS
jgi:hypothetical protein